MNFVARMALVLYSSTLEYHTTSSTSWLRLSCLQYHTRNFLPNTTAIARHENIEAPGKKPICDTSCVRKRRVITSIPAPRFRTP